MKKKYKIFILWTIIILSGLPTWGQYLPEQIRQHPQKYFHFQNQDKPLDYQKWKAITKDINYLEEEKKTKKKKQKKQKTSSSWEISPMAANIFRWFIIGMAIFILATLVYAAIVRGSLFQKTGKKVSPNVNSGSIEDLENRLPESDLDSPIEQAIQSGNYSLAIRLYYLALIKELSLHNYITWQRNKTNRDYLREMRKHTLFEAFRNNTRIFERVFYGNISLQENDFKSIQPQFTDLLNKIKNNS